MERWQIVFLKISKVLVAMDDEEFELFKSKASEFFGNMPRIARFIFRWMLTFVEVWFLLTRFRPITKSSDNLVLRFVKGWASSRFLFKRNIISAVKGFAVMIWSKVLADSGKLPSRELCRPVRPTRSFWERGGEEGRARVVFVWEPENFHSETPKTVCIGNFDGIHEGHKTIFREGYSRRNGTEFWIMTFIPHPKIVFQENFFPLSTLFERFDVVRGMFPELAGMLAVNFLAVKDWEAETFASWLREKLNVKRVVVGEDFCFGKGARGNADTLRKAGIEVVSVPVLRTDGKKISSSHLRDAILKGDVELFFKLTGRFYAVWGCVVKGQGLGGKIGFPTANISTPQKLPADGVYVCIVEIDGMKFPAVANVGAKPTVGVLCKNLEVHILDFRSRIYGKVLRVEFVKKIRDVRKFRSVDELARQIERDVSFARMYFRREFPFQSGSQTSSEQS